MSTSITNRILDIVFVLDTTWSMDERDQYGVSIMERMNDLIEKMMRSIVADVQTSEAVQVAFLTFADDITMETEFLEATAFEKEHMKLVKSHCRNMKVIMKPVNTKNEKGETNAMKIPRFSSVGARTSSRIGRAVKYAIKKLWGERERQKSINGNNAKFYAPIMILITDGAPPNKEGKDTMDPKEEQEAIDLVYDHCRSSGDASNLIFPVICGIGDEQVEAHLKKYSRGYLAGFQHIDKVEQSKGFDMLIKRIGISITRSYNLNDISISTAGNYSGQKKKTENYREKKGPVFTLNDNTDDEDEEI